jgi:capsular polysaccharide transport system permease protein
MPDSSDFATYARLLRLTPVDPALVTRPDRPVVEDAAEHPRGGGMRSLWAVLLCIALPTLIGAIYFGLIASDRFESESRFVIRAPGQSTSSATLSSLMQTAGIPRSAEDSFIVHDYLESRDAMTFLVQRANLGAAFDNKAADLLWRFPNFYTSNTQEGMYWHYRRMISASYDTSTGVSTLRVQAFSSADAYRLSSALLDAAETLINRLNDRARRDTIAFAEGEVDRMRQRALAAQEKLTAFRERETLIDPSQATMAVLETIARLSSDAANVSVQLAELQRSSPTGPQISALKARQAAIEAQISTERHRLAGDSTSIAPRIAEYERLMLEREFSERALVAALGAVEMARIEAQRKQVYIERVAEPSRPDHPAYPLRVVWCLAILLTSYMAFRMGKALVDDARQHAAA